MKVSKAKRLLFKTKAINRKLDQIRKALKETNEKPWMALLLWGTYNIALHQLQQTPAGLFGPNGVDKRRIRRHHRKQRASFGKPVHVVSHQDLAAFKNVDLGGHILGKVSDWTLIEPGANQNANCAEININD